ncbi:TPA: CaiF/GrlA family transcriptional regulator [Klebsiella aerogenes]
MNNKTKSAGHLPAEDPVEQTGNDRSGKTEASALPLYLRVALWVLVQGRGVTRDEIAEEFRISVRQAGDLMLYISTSGSKYVDATRTTLRGPGRGMQAVLEVAAVHTSRYVQRRTGRPTRARPAPDGGTPVSLRDLFLYGSRRRGNDHE